MFTGKMSKENKAAKEKATKLLISHGWSVAEEKRLYNQGEDVSQYIRETMVIVAQEIQQTYLPDVPLSRIKTQVARVMGQERGKVWREERGL